MVCATPGVPPPQPRKAKKPKSRKPRHAKRPRRAKGASTPHPRPAAQAPAERFIPTVDERSCLVIVNGAEPHIFNEAQTAAIASLLFLHYDKA
jgi:hypothetical protein